MRRLHWFIFIAACVLTGINVLPAQTQPVKADLQTFAIIYEPGPNWIKGQSIYEQDLQEHGQYMSKLLDQGHLEIAGPFSDSTGGMAIVTAKDRDEALSIMNSDPGIIKGVFRATVRPWNIVFRKQA